MPPAPPPFPPAAADADLAAQVARINADAMADAPAAEPPEKRGGIFARLRRSRAPVPPEPGLGDAGMADAKISDAGMGKSDAGMGDASMDEGPQDAGMDERLGGSMGDAGVIFDPALAEQALPQEKRKAPPIVAIGWLLLALFVAGVVGALALAPSAVTSILPGASRLYALFGAPADASGLAFEGVRYGWNDQGGQAVLEVQGDVVNHTSAAVPVPTLVIALADASGEEISEWTTEIGEEELAPGGRAPFLRQIPSPPSNVRSVKVRFAKSN
jgi:hypothetical protein